jgi:hypothetical protein
MMLLVQAILESFPLSLQRRIIHHPSGIRLWVAKMIGGLEGQKEVSSGLGDSYGIE